MTRHQIQDNYHMDKIVTSLLKISGEELATAKTEYKKGVYHKSLFLFQQAVEKAYKALALDTRQIGLDDLKKVGHDYVKLLKTSLKNLPEDLRTEAFAYNAELFNYSDPLEENEIYIELMRLGRTDFFNMTDEDINNYLKYISKYKRLAFKSNFSNLADIVTRSNKLSAEELAEFLAEQQSGFTTEQLKVMTMFQSHGVTLQLLGLMTSPHSEQTRYPLEHNDYKCPTEIYTMDFPLIKHQNKLMKMADDSIKFIKTHCPMSTSQN